MARSVADLIGALDLERIELNIFRGRVPQVGRQRVFGGLVVAQALVAAARTVEDRAPHSLHAYFVLPGDPSLPIIYEVERVRDGRSFTTRRCVAVQAGRPIFDLFASFHKDEPGLEHQVAMPRRARTPIRCRRRPRSSSVTATLLPPALKAWFKGERAIELRPCDLSRYDRSKPPTAEQNVWIRAARAPCRTIRRSTARC